MVEQYFLYHVDCLNGCGLGKSAGDGQDSPYFQVGYGSFYDILDSVDSLVESFLPFWQGFTWEVSKPAKVCCLVFSSR